jgi:hypothetical protein
MQVQLMQVQLINPGLLEMSLRLHHRAVSLALAGFLEYARFSLELGQPLPPAQTPSTSNCTRSSFESSRIG